MALRLEVAVSAINMPVLLEGGGKGTQHAAVCLLTTGAGCHTCVATPRKALRWVREHSPCTFHGYPTCKIYQHQLHFEFISSSSIMCTICLVFASATSSAHMATDGLGEHHLSVTAARDPFHFCLSAVVSHE